MKTRYVISAERAKEIVAASKKILKKNSNEDLMFVALGKEMDVAPSTARRKLWYSKKVLAGDVDLNLVNNPNKKIKEPKPEPTVEQQLGITRLKFDLEKNKRQLKDTQNFAMRDKALREAAFGLASEPLSPPSWKVSTDKQNKSETIIMMLSDAHVGEVVNLDQMDGKNSYNVEIAGNRIKRYFETAIKFATVYWYGPPPECIYLCLMGDMITGEIHEELSKTNDLQSIGSVKAASQFIAAGLSMLVEAFPKIPINVVSIPGNHARTSRKPEHKNYAVESYDTLIGYMVEQYSSAMGWKNVSFSAPKSGDALLNIYGYKFLVTHGDRIGSRGGTGMIGPAATATRGFQRVAAEYAKSGDIIDQILIGHFHAQMELEGGIVNGSLIGYNEYARAGRFYPHKAAQWMLAVHPNRPIARRWLIQVGKPVEGSMYKSRNATE